MMEADGLLLVAMSLAGMTLVFLASIIAGMMLLKMTMNQNRDVQAARSLAALDAAHRWAIKVITEGESDNHYDERCPYCFIEQPQWGHHDGCPCPEIEKALGKDWK